MIVLCINCGWLGTEKELGAMPIKSDRFKAIIEANNMHMKACPSCKETELCCKTECDNLYNVKIPYSPPGPVDPAELIAGIEEVVEKYSEPESEDTGVDDILSIAAKSNIPVAKLGADGKIKIPRLKPIEQQCDICGKTFKANFVTSRCDKCYDKLMDKMQGDVDKEEKNKVAKKKTKKKKTTKKKTTKKKTTKKKTKVKKKVANI